MRTPPALVLITAAIATAGSAACFGAGSSGQGDVPRERRAALARLIVDNRTSFPLAIAFRYAIESGGPGGEIGVGTAPPAAQTEVAPVPAEEPIILFARGPRFERRLEPITLEIDELRVWVVRPDGDEQP